MDSIQQRWAGLSSGLVPVEFGHHLTEDAKNAEARVRGGDQ